MVALGDLAFVFVAGFLTALATGIGAVPFFVVEDISDRVYVVLWGLASGIMVSASLFGLLLEGMAYGSRIWLVPGMLTGVVLVVVGHRVVTESEMDPRQYAEADFKKLVLILGVLTVHSFPEGVAVGVAFAELGIASPAGETVAIFGYAAPILGIFMTIAISIHNVPEGVAISIPLEAMGVSNPRKVWWAVFSSLPQPLGAVIAFYFVSLAKEFLPFGFGFAAGAMIYLVVTEFIPEGLETGAGLPNGGRAELVGGVVAGVLLMIPLAFV
jgi:ZIP family zinc transporter